MVEKEQGWVEAEFGNIDLSDKRLRERFLKVAEALSRNPQAPINQANKDWAATKAAYRLFANERVSSEDILRSHREATLKRIKEHDVVLAIQDTTYLNFAGHHACEGLGVIGTEKLKGVVAHNTLLCTTEGLPLGLYEQKLYTREAKKEKAKTIENESIRWFESIRRIASDVKEHSKIVTICDREGDITKLFHEIVANGMNFIIRAAHRRSVKSEEFRTSFEAVKNSKQAGTIKIIVPPREGKKSYEVMADVRYTNLTILSRTSSKNRDVSLDV